MLLGSSFLPEDRVWPGKISLLPLSRSPVLLFDLRSVCRCESRPSIQQYNSNVAEIETLFLDAGGVLVFPNWQRISDTLGERGVHVSVDALIAAEPKAKFDIDQGIRRGDTTDAQRAWLYMELVLENAGVTLSEATAAALRELRAYHAEHNLWEYVPSDVMPALDRMSSLGLKLVVVSNANGVLHRAFERLGLTRYFDCICDSFLEGVEKPDPRFFQIAMERSGAVAETTMHVGDLYYVDVIGARNTGLRQMLIDPYGLYGEYDSDRVRTLGELADRLQAGARS
jgi:putative hydrolase of the HAD superfamily